MKKISAIAILTLMIILVVSPLAGAASGNTGSIIKIAGNIIIEQGQVVHGDVVSIFGNVEVHGEVYGNVVTVIGNSIVYPSGKVWGDAVAVVGNLETQSGSSIAGNKVNVVGNGSDVRVPNINFVNIARNSLGFRFNPVSDTLNLVTGILLATLVVALFPTPVERVKRSIQNSPGRMALIGLLVWLVAVPLIFLVGLTIIGLPLAFLMGVGMWVAGRLGYAALVLIIGNSVLKNTESAPALAALGALLLGVVTLVPVVGGLVCLAMGLVAMGAAIITRLGTRDELDNGDGSFCPKA